MNAARNQSATHHRLTSLCAVIVVFTVMCSSGCSRKSTQSVNEEYVVLVSSSWGERGIDIVDCELDSVVQEVESPRIVTNFAVSPDGNFVAWHTGSLGTLILHDRRSSSTQSATLPNLGSVIESLAFTKSPLRLLVMTMDSTLVYDVSSLQLDTVWHVSIYSAHVRSTSADIIALGFDRDTLTDDLRASVMLIDPVDGAVKSSRALSCNGVPVQGYCCGGQALDPDGNTIYKITYRVEDGIHSVFAFDVASGECRYSTPLEVFNGDITITPDGSELWITQGGFPPDVDVPEHLGYILILDAVSGAVIDTVHSLGHRLDKPALPLNLTNTVAHPTMAKVYVAGRSGRPGILVLNSETHEIISEIYAEDVGIYHLAIAGK